MEETEKSISKALLRIQSKVVVPKARYNEYGGFYYRSYEDIVAALKKPCEEEGVLLSMSDSIVQVGERYYVEAKATARIVGTDYAVTATGYAREADSKKGSDPAQITGMASSYARKYALCGLFGIDSTSDPDGQEPSKAEKEEKQEVPAEGPFTAHCRSCGTRYQFADAAQYMEWIPTCHCCPTPDWVIERG